MGLGFMSWTHAGLLSDPICILSQSGISQRNVSTLARMPERYLWHTIAVNSYMLKFEEFVLSEAPAFAGSSEFQEFALALKSKIKGQTELGARFFSLYLKESESKPESERIIRFYQLAGALRLNVSPREALWEEMEEWESEHGQSPLRSWVRAYLHDPTKRALGIDEEEFHAAVTKS